MNQDGLILCLGCLEGGSEKVRSGLLSSVVGLSQYRLRDGSAQREDHVSATARWLIPMFIEFLLLILIISISLVARR